MSRQAERICGIVQVHARRGSDDTDQLQQLIIDQATELRFLQEQLNLLIRKRLAASSEKYPGQHELFDEAEQEAAPEEGPVEDEASTELPYTHATRGVGETGSGVTLGETETVRQCCNWREIVTICMLPRVRYYVLSRPITHRWAFDLCCKKCMMAVPV